MGLDEIVGQCVIHFRVNWAEVLEVVGPNG